MNKLHQRRTVTRVRAVAILLGLVASATSAHSQSLTVIAKTGDAGLAGGMWPEHSINDSGEVAFNGRFTTGNFEQSLFVGTGSGLVNVTPGARSTIRAFYAVSLTNGRRVVADWNQFSNQQIESYDVANPSTPPLFIAQGGTSGFFQELVIFTPVGNSAGQVAFYARLRGSGASVVATRGPSGYNTLQNFLSSPRLAENGKVGLRTGTEVRLYNYELTTFDAICTAADGFSGINGFGMSDDSRIVVFAGTLSAAGAAAINARQSAFHYSSFTPLIPPLSDGVGLYAGVSVEGMLDATETPVRHVLVKLASAGGDLASLDAASRVSASNPQELTGSQVVFAGTGSDARRRIFATNLRLLGSIGSPSGFVVGLPLPLVAVGDSIPGLSGTISSLSLSDSINNINQVAFFTQMSGGTKAVVRSSIDSDGDGLLDDWERTGIPYTDAAGNQQRYILDSNGDGISDANWQRKDLFVEVDAMSGLALSAGAVPFLTTAFNNAPLSNPDGSTGISIHVTRDESNLAPIAAWQTLPPDDCWPATYSAVRASHYGTPSERGNTSASALLAAKAKAFRYCIVADRAAPRNIGGCAETPGDSFVIFLGSSTYNDEDQAAVFMHELGHNLGLDHGGGDDVNGKPNYPSIMNYALAYRLTWNMAFWRLDFSRAGVASECTQGPGEFCPLNEANLNEGVGIGTSTGVYRNFRMPFGVSGVGSTRLLRYIQLNGTPRDLGDMMGTGVQDGMFTQGVSQDLNYVTSANSGLPTMSSPGQVLNPHNDWAAVRLPLAATLGPGASAPTYPTDELTGEAREWMRLNFPIPPDLCPADFNGIGGVTVQDIFDFLAAYFSNDPRADINGVGGITVQDIFDFLAAYFAGCP